MARTKQTPRNPNIDRPIASVGSDIESAERRPTPRKKGDPKTKLFVKTRKSLKQGRQAAEITLVQEIAASTYSTSRRD